MCTAATYKTNDFYFGRTLDNDFSYGEKVTITPRNYSLKFIRASAQSNNDIKGNFNKTEVQVYGNNNTLATKYNVYTYIPNAAWNNVDELTVSV